MRNTKAQLELDEAILALIERKRQAAADPELGAAVEELILSAQVRDIESEILESPGAIEPWLIRLRRPPEC